MSPRASLPARIAPVGAPRAPAPLVTHAALFGALDRLLMSGLTDAQAANVLGRRFGSAYQWHAWVYTCLKVRARAVSSLPRCEYTGDPKKPRPVPDSPWTALLDRPSPGWTWKRFTSMSEIYLGLVGEVFYVAEGVGDDLAPGEVPAAIFVRPGGRMATPIRGPDGNTIVGWTFLGARGGSVNIPAHRVCQIAYENPDDPERGLAPLEALRTSVEGDDYAAQYNRNFFRKSAVPAGVMVAPANAPFMRKEEIDQQSTEYHDKFGGVDKVGRVAFLQAGVTFQRIQQSQVDSGLWDGRRWTRDEIAGVFEVPQFFLGLTTDLKYATAEASRRVFYESTVIPEGQMIADALNASFLHRGTDPMARARAAVQGERVVWVGYDLSTVSALRDAEGDRLDRFDKLVALGYSRNEANTHLELGLPQIPEDEGGDARMVSFGLAPLPELAGTAPVETTPPPNTPPPTPGADPAKTPVGLPAGGDAVQDTALNGSQIASLLEIILQVAAGELPGESGKAALLAAFPTLTPDEVNALIDPAVAKAKEKSDEPAPVAAPPTIPPESKKALAAIIKRGGNTRLQEPCMSRAHRQDEGAKRRQRAWLLLQSRVYVPGERAMLTACRTHFRDVIGDVSTFLDGGARARDSRDVIRMSAGELDAYLAGKRAEWDAALQALAHPVYGRTAKAGLVVLQHQLPKGFGVIDAEDPRILKFLATKELKLVDVNQTLLDGVRGSLLEGSGENETIGQLRQRLEREQGLSMTRARNVARTEVASCSNGARHAAMQEAEVDGREWATSGDDNVRESHAAMDGVVIPVDGSYAVGGATLRFPGDPDGPASEICQCRCGEGPVLT